MHEIPLISEVTIIAVLGVVVTVILSRLQLPTVAGLLVAGALMGPYGFALVQSVHDIEMLAEVGVVLLLFTIGLEFSLTRLKDIFRQVALGGVLQVGATFGATYGIARLLGQPVEASVFFGFAIALSSTAIVLRTLDEREELDAPHGRFIVGTLIFQDLCVVPMVLVVPLLGAAGGEQSMGRELAEALGLAALVVVATISLSRFVVPRLLALVDASRSREVFLLAILALCIGTAWLTSQAGLSLALGAFLGGMVVADTEYGHRAMADILPLRHAFVSIFFVVMGMLFKPFVVMEQPLLVFGILVALIVGKAVIATFSAMAMRFPARAAWLAGLGLAQFGEFGFVLTKLAQENDVVSAASVEPVLTAGIMSMFLTPLLVRVAPHIRAGEKLLAPLESFFNVRSIDELSGPQGQRFSDHVIIVGFGVAGRLASNALADCERDVLIVEMGIENVKWGKELGFPVYYGDATSQEVLSHARVRDARMVVLLVNDPPAAKRIVDTISRLAPNTPILMRTRYLRQRTDLMKTGAHDVVAEEVEGAVEVVSRMLRALEIPRNLIEHQIDDIRANTQTSERSLTIPRARLDEVNGLNEMKIESVLVEKTAPADGRSPKELDLRRKTGALVVGVRRNGTLLESPDASEPFQARDTVYLVGNVLAVQHALPYFVVSGEAADELLSGDGNASSDARG